MNLKGGMAMYWMQEPVEYGRNGKGVRDNCIVQICWSREYDEACVIRWCVTKVCAKDY